MPVKEEVRAHGHPNIKGTHRTTLEITSEEEVTPRGDCIVGVGADKTPADFNKEFIEALRRPGSILIAILSVGELRDIVLAEGSPSLMVSSGEKLIIRRSSYVEPATIGVRSNKAAGDLDRRIIERLRDPSTTLHVRLIALGFDEIDP